VTAYKRDLVRDVAGLVAKHGLADISALIEGLKRTDALDELAFLIAELEQRLSRQRAQRAQPVPRRPTKQSGAKISDGLASVRNHNRAAAEGLEDLHTRLVARSAFGSAQELKVLWTSAGRKDPIPRERRRAVRQLVLHLAGLPVEQLSTFLTDLQKINTTPTSSYREWAATIMGPPPSELGHAGPHFHPRLSLTAEREINRWLISIVAHPRGGEARDIHVVWRCHGGVALSAQDVAQNRVLTRDAAGSFRQDIPVPLPPGERTTLAYVTANRDPWAITYAIRAARGYVARGHLKMTDRGFVAAQEGEPYPADGRAEF